MYGAILGDIIGSPYEFSNHRQKDKNFPLFIKDSTFTDDTVLTCAIAEMVLRCGKQPNGEQIEQMSVKLMQLYGNRYPDKSYGLNFKKWLNTTNPQPYNSLGNGSAMRVAPIGWAYDNIELTRFVARHSAWVTHNHKEGIKGAEAVACAIYLARTNHTKTQIKTYIEQEFPYDFNRTLDSIRPQYHMDETCPGSVPESILAFLESTNTEDAIRNAISLGGDTDTMAAIAGSIAEAYYQDISNEMKQICLSYLPNDLREIVQLFDQRIMYVRS